MVLQPFSSRHVARCTDLVVCEVCFVKEATEIKNKKDKKHIKLQDEKNVTKWNF
jgi:hypothetical protein